LLDKYIANQICEQDNVVGRCIIV